MANDPYTEILVQRSIKDVLLRCEQQKGFRPLESEAAETIRSVIVHDPQRFNLEKPLLQEDLEHLITVSVQTLSTRGTPRNNGSVSSSKGGFKVPRTDKYLRARGELTIEPSHTHSAHEAPTQTAPQPAPTKCDGGTQTEVHPVENHIDRSYHWNEWELRRRALKLADLRSKKTTSQQTDLSHFRRENVTQHWAPREFGTQTGIDKGTSVPRQVTYLKGLRGADQKVSVVNVTLSL